MNVYAWNIKFTGMAHCRDWNLNLNLQEEFGCVLSRDQVNQVIKNFSDSISIGAYCDQDAIDQVNPQVARTAASIVKPFIFLYVLKNRGKFHNMVQTEDIKLTDDTILRYFKGSRISMDGLLALMTEISDNSVANYFLDRIGIDKMNQFLKEEGYPDTSFGRRFLDSDARMHGKENYTSVTDLYRLYHGIISGSILGAEDRNLFISIMRAQFDRSKFALYLPESIESGGKSGVLENVWNDLIFFSHNGSSVILIGLTENLPGPIARDFLPAYSFHFIKERYPELLQDSL